MPACPSEAIYPANAVPGKYYVEIDERLAERCRAEDHSITEKTGPVDSASEWEGKEKSAEEILAWKRGELPRREVLRTQRERGL